MRFFHISDLHIGKRVNGFSMLEDQKYILKRILELADENAPDGIWIAGDLYDKSQPSAEAVETVDWFLSQFAVRGIPVWAISGNHDSPERVAYGSGMLEHAGIYMNRVFDGKLQGYLVTKFADKDKPVISRITEHVCERAESRKEAGGRADGKGMPEKNVLQITAEKRGGGSEEISDRVQVGMSEEEISDPVQSGVSEKQTDILEQVCIWLLPYLRPAQVRRFFPEREIETTQQAVEAVLAGTELPEQQTHILVMHQFLAGAAVCDSEELSIGGLDQVSVSAVDGFDYVALGHLHRPQKIGRETVRYCGSPLKYSFSEAGHQKSVTVVETGPGKAVSVRTIPLTPKQEMREIRGPIDRLLESEIYEAADRKDYLHITLTDEEEVLDAIGRLREVYPNIMRLDFEKNQATADDRQQTVFLDEKTPAELFAEFYELQNGRKMSEEQRCLVETVGMLLCL